MSGPRYDAILTSTRALLVKPHIEFLLLLLAYAGSVATSESLYPSEVSTWVAPIRDGTRSLSLAGWWLLLVSQPLYQLLIAMWLYRVALWARLLWKLARLDLRLLPSHPDRAGGLSFVATSLRGFAAVGFGLGAAVAAGVAEAVFVDGRPVTEFKFAVARAGHPRAGALRRAAPRVHRAAQTGTHPWDLRLRRAG